MEMAQVIHCVKKNPEEGDQEGLRQDREATKESESAEREREGERDTKLFVLVSQKENVRSKRM
uniref:Uncharacterized protein n=1 Tax=Anguilla anguilla TaxID=7936 RepID=A0A0E9SH75_ANGAN